MNLDHAFSALTIKSVDEEKREIRGWATTPTPDRIGDIVEPHGLRYAKQIPLFLYHDSKQGVGHAELGRPTKDGVPFVARIPKITEPGRLKDLVDEAWQRVKYKLIAAVSIGFKEVAGKVEQLKGGGLRYLEAEVLELSLVPIPMNAAATIDSVKAVYKSFDATQRRAALGHKAEGSRDGSTPAGATAQRPGRTIMKTLQELQARRDEVAERMKELWTGCGSDRSQLQAEEVKEFDSLKKELGELDASIDDERSIASAAAGAVAVSPSAITSQAAGSRIRAGLPAEPKRKEDPARKGVAFAQYVRLMYHAKGMPFIALQLAERSKFRSGLDPRVPMVIKAAVEAGSVGGSSTAGNWGMELVGDETGAVADFAEYLRPQTILGRFGADGIPALNEVPFRTPLLSMTAGLTGYWVGEGKAKPLSKGAFARTTLEPLKCAALTAVTKELLMDSSPKADVMLRNELGASLIAVKDLSFIDPANAGSANVEPAAVTNGITPIAATGTGDAADVRTDIRALLSAFRAANNPPRSGVWIMNSNTAIALGLMMNALGQSEFPGINMNGGSLQGLPIIVSDYVPADTNGHIVVLINAQDVFYAEDGAVQVMTSEHASLEMDNAPSHDSVTPTESTLVSMFQTNSVAFLAEQRLNWKRRRDSGVQVLSGANWGEA